MHLRRSALRLYFRTLRQLGLCAGDPTIDLALRPRSCLAVRPLTDDEIVVCRSFSLQTLTATRQP
jgi:integrase/recombinase XerC